MNPVTVLNILDHALALGTESPETGISRSEYVTLTHRGIMTWGDDQFRLVSRAVNSEWGAARLEKNRLSANFQGSPLWPMKVLKNYPDLLQFFFLDACYSENSCILPMTSTINHRLEKLVGEEFGFEEFEGTLSDQMYVDAFIDRGRLPMAEMTERDSIHDWSYHFITFLFPEYLEGVRANLLWVRDRLSCFSGWTTYSWNYYGHSMDEAGQMCGQGVREEMSHVDAVYRQMAISLDVATAKIVQLLMLQESSRIANCRSEVQSIEVFMKGPSEQAIRKILWMEPEISLELPASKLEEERIMKHLDKKLQSLEQKAREISGTTPYVNRTQVMKTVLERLDRRT